MKPIQILPKERAMPQQNCHKLFRTLYRPSAKVIASDPYVFSCENMDGGANQTSPCPQGLNDSQT